LKQLLLNFYYWPAFLLITCVGLTLLPFILIVNTVVLKRGLSQSLRLAIRFYGWVLVCLVTFMAPVKVIGDTRTIPKPSIIVANHNSAIDPFLFGAIPTENCFVTSWPFKIPIYGMLMRWAGYIDIADGWKNIRNQCIDRLTAGSSITIWPEGHRSRDGRLGRFRKGAFQLAVETGYPIQPICIIGSADIMSPGERVLSPGRVKIIILDPLFPDKDIPDLQTSTSQLCQQCVDAIELCLKEHHNCKTVDPHDSGSDNCSHVTSETFTSAP